MAVTVEILLPILKMKQDAGRVKQKKGKCYRPMKLNGRHEKTMH